MTVIRLETALLHNVIPLQQESFRNNLLVKVMPAGGTVGVLPLNVALVLDVSGSMYSENPSRLEYVQEAAKKAIQAHLKPTDIISIVAFGDDSRVVREAASSDPAELEKVINTIDGYGVRPGGTSMHLGMRDGVEQVRRNLSEQRLNRVVVLTDGLTRNPEECVLIAERERDANISFSTMGVGEEWNWELLEEVANKGHGKQHYIDSRDKALAVFGEEFGQMAATAFSNVQLRAVLEPGVSLVQGNRVYPQCRKLEATPERAGFIANLGTMQRDEDEYLLFDLRLPARPAGVHTMAQLELRYDVPSLGTFEATGLIPVTVEYTGRGPGATNPEVAQYAEHLRAYQLYERALGLEDSDKLKAQQLLENALRIARGLGPTGTELVQILEEELRDLKVPLEEAARDKRKKTQTSGRDRGRMTKKPDRDVSRKT